MAEGSTIFPAVHDFLAHFGGLHIHHPNPLAPDDTEAIDLDPAEAARSRYVDPESLSEYRARAGKPLCAIGMAANGYMLLMMAPDGRVYGAVDDLLYDLGASWPEALESLTNQAPLIQLPDLPAAAAADGPPLQQQ
jgi:hypothetical protein